MEAIQVVERIFGLDVNKMSDTQTSVGETLLVRYTHIHYIIKHDKCSSLGFLFVPYTNLPYTPIAPKQVVQIFPSNLVVQILYK